MVFTFWCVATTDRFFGNVVSTLLHLFSPVEARKYISDAIYLIVVGYSFNLIFIKLRRKLVVSVQFHRGKMLDATFWLVVWGFGLYGLLLFGISELLVLDGMSALSPQQVLMDGFVFAGSLGMARESYVSVRTSLSAHPSPSVATAGIFD